MKQYNYSIHIDRLEITYLATQEQKNYLANKEYNEFYFNGITLRRCECRNYENEFAIISTDLDKEQRTYERCIGHLHFGSPNPNRQNVYVVYENDALYNKMWLACRFYIEEALRLEFKQISKLDIATDFNFNISRRFYKVYKDGNFDLIINGKKVHGLDNKVKDVVHITGNTTRKRPFANPTPVVKNADGSLALRAYNKSEEIDETSGKEYVRDATGFSRLWRLEVSCGNHRVIKNVLDKLGMSDEDLYADLGIERVIICIFKAMIDRLIRVKRNRHCYSLIDAMLDDL